MAEAMAVLAPNANSYRRYVSHSYAPTAPNWGVNNRTVALRIPAGPRPRAGLSIASRAPMPIRIWRLRWSSQALTTD